jgi:hypothetical protein
MIVRAKIALGLSLFSTALAFCQTDSHPIIFNFPSAPVKMSEAGKSGFTVANSTRKTINTISFAGVVASPDSKRVILVFKPYPLRVDPSDSTTELSTGRFWQRDSCETRHGQLTITVVSFSDGSRWEAQNSPR